MTAAAVPQTAREVLLIDLSAIFRAVYHVNADQPLSVAFQGTLDGVRRCMNNRNALVAICCDGKGNWRKELAPSYKAHREAQPESMYDILDRVKARLKADGLLLWECPGFEADDLLATATDAAVMAGHEVTICSHDKDVLQLLKPEYVRMLKTSTWETVDYEAMVAKFGVTPGQFTDWLALTGDASDGVAGVPGVGPKTASELLKAHNSIEGIYDAMAKGTIELKGKKLEALQQNIPQLELARKLVALRYDAPIDFSSIYETREPARLTEEDPDMDAEDAEFSDPAISPPPPKANGSAPKPVPVITEVKPDAPPPQPEESTALATQAISVVQVPYEQQLEPNSIGTAYKLAKGLFESRLYARFPNAEAIWAVIIRGRELGLGALTALDSMHLIEGKPYPSAHLLIALAKKHPDCAWFQYVSGDAKQATWSTQNKRNPKPTTVTYTIEMAQAAGLLEKANGPWNKHRESMLAKMCGVRLCRLEYPDSILGLLSSDEMGVEP